MSPVRLPATARGLQRELIAIFGIVALGVIPLIAYLIWSGYQAELKDADTATRNYAAILEARLDATLRRADAVLLAMARTIPVAALSQQAVPRYADELNANLGSHLVGFKELASFNVGDRYGASLYSSDGVSTPNVNVADRGYFRELRDKPQAGLVFSEVIVSRVTKRPAVVMARALTDGDGNFAGIILAVLELESFQKLLESLDIGPQGLITLRRSDDHRLVVRRPHLDAETNIPLNPQHPVVKSLAAGAKAASLHFTAQSDGVQRIFSYHALEGYPFLVNVGVGRADVLADWRTRSRAIGAAGLLLLGVLAGLVFRLWRSMVREARVTAELRESDRLAQASLEALSAHIAVLDADGRILATNRRWREFAEQNGGAAESVSEGADYLGICRQAVATGEKGGTSAVTLIQDLISGRRTEGSFEYVCHSPQEQRWFDCRGSRFTGNGPVRVILAHMNVTEHKQVGEALRRLNQELETKVLARTAELQQANAILAGKEQEIRSVVENIADGIITIDERGIVASANRAAERLFGYTAAEMVGQNVTMLMPEPYHSQHDGYLERYRATGEARVIGIGREVMGRRKDGSTFPLELSVTAMQLGDERRFTGIVRDITERKRAVERIQKLSDRLQLANESTGIGVWDWGVVNNDLVWDAGMYKLYGVEAGQFGGAYESWLAGVHPQDAGTANDAIQAALSDIQPYDVEFRVVWPNGDVRWLKAIGTVQRDRSGKPLRMVGTNLDITDRKQAEQALVAAKDAAELANKAKDSFLATMSHEIRTPLGGLLGMLELLSLSQLNPEQDETLQTARDSGRSLLRILNDILDLSKIEEGRLELAAQAVSIAGLVAEVTNTYSHVASGNNVTLTQRVDERLSPALIVDPLRLSQVLNNFVSNAIKFSRGGRVELRAELLERQDGAEQVRFSVKDTGIGIDPEVQQRLFESYGQASAATARMYGGTGLGLAICRRLADLLDGRIELDSAPGRGSTFSLTLTLPIAQTVVEAGQAPAAMVPAASVQPFDSAVVAADAPLVLVVDDNPINRKLLARQLGLLGLRAETAEDGEAALALWRTRRFGLVITDCHMPQMDGYALTRAMRGIEVAEARSRTPIFAWTANALAVETQKCHAAGMDELLVKPADLGQLKTVLANWLPAAAVGSAATAAQDAVSPAPTIATLDVSVLAALVGDDPATIREFLLDFRASAATIAAELSAACAAGQAAQAGALAHKLKSSARSVGALALGELCGEMEAAGKDGQIAVLSRVWPRFEAEMAAVDAALADLTAHEWKTETGTGP